ncbi:hypothetical protein Tco_1133020 [Tanacetum coccineum]|uniref:Uncharacterized protein n=1 Tax=Tanacetum coccineum TaxID=301880 RepID=A0ABQ5JE87_9ASTR
MTKEQDEQQQQNMLDVELDPINDQVNIGISNFRIAFEKTQPDVIYKQFWYTVAYDLTTKAHFFKIDDQIFENDQISKRSLSFHHVIKLDATLGNIKFANKGIKEPVFGKAILDVMLNDDIKASAEYSKRTIGLRRPTGVVIGGEARKESDEERVDHSKDMQGIEILSGYSSEDDIEDISSDKEDKRDDDKEKADESQKADEEILATDRIDDEKAEEEHVEKQGGNEQAGITQTDFLNDNPDVTVNEVLKDSVKPKVQSMVDIPIQQAKLAEQRPPLVDTTMTLIPDTTTISPTKPPQTQPKRSKIKRILKKSKKPDTQVDSGELKSRVTRLEKTVTAISRFNLPDAIDKYVKAHLKNILPKDHPDFGEPQCKSSKSTKVPPTLSPTKKDVDNDEQPQANAMDDTEIKQDAGIATDEWQEMTTALTQDNPSGYKERIGERVPYDLSKPLPLHGPLGRTTIPVDFFNKDLEYLKNGSIERT